MKKLKHIAERLAAHGITCYEVGGSVRNNIMALPIDDIDICLVGAKHPSAVEWVFLELLQEGTIEKMTAEPVGNNFPNWTGIIDGQKVDFALARTEKKTGCSHQDFDVVVEDVTIYDDLFRRDLTINAIAKNILTGEIIDPYGGEDDIKNGLLHPVSSAFAEDELRVIRAARFASYFGFDKSAKLYFFSLDMSPKNISKERIGGELMKVMKYAKKPSLFFEFLRDVKWLEQVFPELHACIGVPQPVKHHPEGDVFTHIMHCIDASDDWFFRTVMLCHDLGKAETTQIGGLDFKQWEGDKQGYSADEFKISAHGHEEAGVPLTMSMLGRISFANGDTRTKIAMLVRLHMTRQLMMETKRPEKIVRRTLRQLMKVGLLYWTLVEVTRLDLSGRPPLQKPEWINVAKQMQYVMAHRLMVMGHMQPIVTGERLVALGMIPGPEMGRIVTKALELQDRGTLREDNWQAVLKGTGFKFFNQEAPE